MSIVDIDSLMDATLDNVEAAADFVTPPTGTYNLSVSEIKMEPFDKKVYDEDGNDTGGKEKAVRIRMTRQINTILEYAEDNAVPVREGSLYSDTYMYDEKGLPLFKRDVAAMMQVEAEELEGISLRDMFDAAAEAEPVCAAIKTTTRKQGDNEYTNVRTSVLGSAMTEE